jgi:hypothetical protein
VRRGERREVRRGEEREGRREVRRGDGNRREVRRGGWGVSVEKINEERRVK